MVTHHPELQPNHVSTTTVAAVAALDHQTEQVVASAVTEALEQEAALAMVANKRPLPSHLAHLPPIPKKRPKWNENRHVYKGVTRRTCLCGQKECFPLWKQWIDLGDKKRCGYYRLGWAPCRDTPRALERFHHRDVMYMHLLGMKAPRFTKDDPKRTVKQFIAYHHFPPALLMDDNKGPLRYVPPEIATKIDTFTEDDKFKFTEDKKHYFHPIPSYTFVDMEMELKETHSSKRKRVFDFLKRTQENPDLVAEEFLKIEDELARTVKTLEETRSALAE
ncbi:MAG: hypothetical protein AAGJ35_16010, partial [Myxococcota bacterium]